MKMLTVWIFQTGEPVHSDVGDYREMRAMNLANAIIESGHKVVIWTTSFFHQEKKHRSLYSCEYKISDNLCIKLISSPGYQSNIGIDRLWDHALLAKNLNSELLKEITLPDVAFVGYPPIEFAYIAIKWLKARKVPVMIDVKDQWPHIFTQPFPKLLKPLIIILLLPYYYMGYITLRNANAFSTMSQSFLDWMRNFSGKNPTPYDCITPLTSFRNRHSQENLDKANEWWLNKVFAF